MPSRGLVTPKFITEDLYGEQTFFEDYTYNCDPSDLWLSSFANGAVTNPG